MRCVLIIHKAGVLGWYRVLGHPHWLAAWLTGCDAVAMETRPECDVIAACMAGVRGRLGGRWGDIPEPMQCVRWGGGYFRFFYTYSFYFNYYQ